MQRCQPLWHGGAGTKVWKACQRQGKACKGRGELGLCQPHPGPHPLQQPLSNMSREKKIDLQGKETIFFVFKFMQTGFQFNPNFAHMIGELLRSEAQQNQDGNPTWRVLRVNKVW